MVDAPVILITGASSGFGAATGRLFAENGYRVVLAARRYERLQSLQKEIEEAGGQVISVRTDMSQLEEIHALVERSLDHFGQIDVVFNNAGFGRLNWLENLDPRSDIEAQVDVNVLGVIWLAQAVLPHMITRQSGHIINMASVAGLIATPSYSIYAATKFAVRGFSEALRREVGVLGIKVSTICPGGATTEFGQVAGIDRTTRVSSPDFLTLSAEDVARAVWRLTLRPRRLVIIPWPLRLAVIANNLFPGWVDWAIESLYVKSSRTKQSH